MKNIQYWKNRREEWINTINDMDSKFTNNLVKKYYKKEFIGIEKEISRYYSVYGENNILKYSNLLKEVSVEEKSLLFSDWDKFIQKNPQFGDLTDIRKSFYRLTRLEGLKYELLKKQLEYGIFEENKVKNHLTRVFRTTHHKSFNMYDEQALKTILDKKWMQGENFSRRVWKNRQRLNDFMMKKFSEAVIRGDSYQKTISALRKEYPQVRRRQVERLVRTEGTFVMNETMGYSLGLKDEDDYIFSAVMDNRTSATCRDLDGQIFKWKDRQPNVNFPPMHPNCRSSFDEVFESIDDIKKDL